MSASVDHNALLLQVMAHDLLAPLTATKWQLELLAREGLDAATRAIYMHNLQTSTELGITLTKHAHVAGRVLVSAYEAERTAASLPDTVRNAIETLRAQYERHGLTLEATIDAEEGARELDTELVSLYVWALAKFFLACTPAGSAIDMRGLSAPDRAGGTGYVLVCSAPGIPEADACVETFRSHEPRGSLDQVYVFAKLLHDVAALIGASVSASAQSGMLVVETAFGPAGA